MAYVWSVGERLEKMIDQIWLPPHIHVWAGSAVLVTTLLSVLTSFVLALQNRAANIWLYSVWLLSQVSLMVQVLIGIKLLDQGLGPLQLYIHYLGGLGALFFYVLWYWLPKGLREWRWTLLILSSSGFLFALMAFTIGSMYVAEGRA